MADVNEKIILFPDYEKLKNEVSKLRTEISMLVLERDELLFVACKNIEMEYMLALGDLEYKVYELNTAVLRLKRKAELIQAKKNRQEKVNLPEIENSLEIEFANYQKELNEHLKKMNQALERSQCDVLTEKESKEIKKLYRAIVKELHPDLHPDLTAEQVKLFNNAVRAYENGDLSTLEIINTMLAKPELNDSDNDTMNVLLKEKERLTAILKTIKEKIENIKSEYPYTLKVLLQDKEKVAQKKVELNDAITQLTESLKYYDNKINEMLV